MCVVNDKESSVVKTARVYNTAKLRRNDLHAIWHLQSVHLYTYVHICVYAYIPMNPSVRMQTLIFVRTLIRAYTCTICVPLYLYACCKLDNQTFVSTCENGVARTADKRTISLNLSVRMQTLIFVRTLIRAYTCTTNPALIMSTMQVC